MKTERKIHKAYKDFEEAIEGGISIHRVSIHQTIGGHYLFSKSKDKISLYKLPLTNKNCWKIYCVEGDLFEGREGFSTKKKAIEKIEEYLGVDKLSKLMKEKLEMIKKEKWRKEWTNNNKFR